MDSDEYCALLSATSQKARVSGFESLNAQERVICCADWLHFEVIQGGLRTFYSNSAGNHALATVVALEELGALQTADSLHRLHALFPGGAPSPEREERWVQLETLDQQHGRELWDRFQSEIEGEVDSLHELLEEYLDRPRA